MVYLRLGFVERTEIRRRLSAGESLSSIAVALGRNKSTISRELARNGGNRGYRPNMAQHRAKQQARRPKVFKLERHPWLAEWIERKLELRWSPEQIAGRLRREHPHDPRWWVSPETIYRSIYVQGRGGLNAELGRWLRTGRTRRRSPGTGQGRGQLNAMVMISERPAEIEDRAVPGHWEGDLLLGGRNSQIGTLVERTSRFLVPIYLPGSRTADVVAAELARQIQDLPAALIRSITWDQGKEMARHVDFTLATGIQVYFAEPGKPWQRGTNENTNGLLRDYFPKRETDFREFTEAQIRARADELNDRPRKILGFRTPAEVYAELVALTP